MVAVFVVLALWLGCGLGYHYGTRNERTAWEATELIGLEGNDGWQMTRSKSSTRWLTNLGSAEGKRLQIYYTNPHFTEGPIILRTGPTPVNLPDPRNTHFK